jgi:hypothetical protein
MSACAGRTSSKHKDPSIVLHVNKHPKLNLGLPPTLLSSSYSPFISPQLRTTSESQTLEPLPEFTGALNPSISSLRLSAGTNKSVSESDNISKYELVAATDANNLIRVLPRGGNDMQSHVIPTPPTAKLSMHLKKTEKKENGDSTLIKQLEALHRKSDAAGGNQAVADNSPA